VDMAKEGYLRYRSMGEGIDEGSRVRACLGDLGTFVYEAVRFGGG
jgi:hypothetical protein